MCCKKNVLDEVGRILGFIPADLFDVPCDEMGGVPPGLPLWAGEPWPAQDQALRLLFEVRAE